MSSEPRPILVKRIKKVNGEHHAAAWKIAYADFVTAMMAFFLLMWLLGSTTKADLNGIADYFKTPLKVALAGGSGSGDSSSVIKGGGTDLTRTVGQRKEGELPTEKKVVNIKAAEADLERVEKMRLSALKGRLEAALDANAALKPFRNQIKIELTPEGLRIQVVDEQNRPMFDSGSAVLKDYMRDILREIAKVLNDVPNRIQLSGHTDAKPYAGGERGYSNWELSADRANASRRELIAGGIDDGKILRVVGLGSAVQLDRNDAFNPINRRISITVLNSRTQHRILDNALETPANEPADSNGPDAAGGASTTATPAVAPTTSAAPASAAVATPAAGASSAPSVASAAAPVVATGLTRTPPPPVVTPSGAPH